MRRRRQSQVDAHREEVPHRLETRRHLRLRGVRAGSHRGGLHRTGQLEGRPGRLLQ